MTRPLRSFLFAPATDLHKVDKALSLDADAVILDLEDAVAISEKTRARGLVVDILSRVTRQSIYVRVNGITTPWVVGDLMAVVGNRPAGIMLPKAECAEEVRHVDWLLGRLETEYALPEGGMELIPLVETARGITEARNIAGSCARVKRLAFGAVDYTLDMGIKLTGKGDELFYARSGLVVGSRAAGIEGPIDTVYVNLKDEAGLREECRLARTLGFSGKLVIHPAQIGPVNAAFSPDANEIQYAARVVRAFEEAEAAGVAGVQLEGKFIDYPVAAWARRVLSTARALGLEEDTPRAAGEKERGRGQ